MEVDWLLQSDLQDQRMRLGDKRKVLRVLRQVMDSLPLALDNQDAALSMKGLRLTVHESHRAPAAQPFQQL